MNRRDLINLPNSLTLARIALVPLFVAMLFAQSWYCRSLAFLIFGVASLTDFYDGKIARATNTETTFGRFVDPLADKVLVISALLAFGFSGLVHLGLIVPVIARDVAITGLRIYSLWQGRQMRTSRLSKWKTAFQLFAVAAILFVAGLQEVLKRFALSGSNALEAYWVYLLANGLMAVMLLLTLASGIHYFSRARFIAADPATKTTSWEGSARKTAVS